MLLLQLVTDILMTHEICYRMLPAEAIQWPTLLDMTKEECQRVLRRLGEYPNEVGLQLLCSCVWNAFLLTEMHCTITKSGNCFL